jgi:hypothetical protein
MAQAGKLFDKKCGGAGAAAGGGANNEQKIQGSSLIVYSWKLLSSPIIFHFSFSISATHLFIWAQTDK